MSTNTTLMRTLGRSGIQVRAIGLGCWAAGGAKTNGNTADGWSGVNDDETIRAIHRAMDLGVNFFDTANIYGNGHSERVLAEALGDRRKQAVIATKVGWGFDEATLEGTGAVTTPAAIRECCEASLRRLNTDYIDLLQFHINDYPAEQAGHVRDTLEALVAEGKIRSYGWSTDFADRANSFAEGPNCTAIQVEMNVVDDAADIIAVCEQRNLAAINRGPLAMGLLTGKYAGSSNLPADDVRGPKAPDWMKYFKGGKPNPEWLGHGDGVSESLHTGAANTGALRGLRAGAAQ